MTYLVLRFFYCYHRGKWSKWDYRKNRYERKRGTKIFRARYVRKVYAKLEYHRFWFHHYCELVSAYGHEIDCIHFGKDENTTQSGTCPYEPDRRVRNLKTAGGD